MTVLEPLAPADGPGATPPVASHQAQRRVALAAAIVAAVTAAAAGGWWATHPTALEPVSGTVELPVPIGDSAVITMSAHPTSGVVDLVHVEPVVTENSADATVRALLCGNVTTQPGSDIIGSVRGTAAQVCATAVPARQSPLGRLSPETPYLVVEVSPRAPGTVTVEGLRIRYRTGLQRGEQDSGLTVTVSTSAS